MIRNIPLLRKWVDALRSGKYHQTSGALCKIRGNQTFHCCLGVACRVMVKNGIRINMVRLADNQIDFNGDAGELSSDLMDRLGITDDEHRTLIDMNDDDSKSFREIADYIEKNILDVEPT